MAEGSTAQETEPNGAAARELAALWPAVREALEATRRVHAAARSGGSAYDLRQEARRPAGELKGGGETTA